MRPMVLGTEGDVKATTGIRQGQITKLLINATSRWLYYKTTDWMIVRAAEGGTAVPSAITTWRAAVRTKANAMQVHK